MRFAKHSIAAAAAVFVMAAATGTGCRKAQHDPFPPSGAVANWQKTGETRIYAAGDLWQYIDGDAELYLKAGVVSAATSDYSCGNHIEATVDVYTMNSPAGAHTILARDGSKQGNAAQLGEESVAYEQSVTFRKGPYLVRIVAYQLTPDTRQALLALAHGVEARL
jgi:hypothetical protein